MLMHETALGRSDVADPDPAEADVPGQASPMMATVPEAQFRHLENPKLAFATATSNSDRSPQKVVQLYIEN
jgi:hypothetical protein